MSEEAKSHIKRWEQLAEGRGVWENHWDDLDRLMLRRGTGFSSTTVPGERRNDDLFDGTPLLAARGLANALGGMLRPEGQKLANIKTVEDADENSDEAKDWIADAEERMADEFNDPAARMRQATGECDMDLVVLGTGVIYEGEGRGANSLIFQSTGLKDSYPYFEEDGRPAGMYRVRELTVRQAVSMFGRENVSKTVREKYGNEKYEDKVRYLHCVTQREGGRSDAMLAKNAPYTDLWVDIEAKEEARSGGFREFPYIIPRWDTSSGESYGRSPGMIALPDASTLQAMGETILVAGQRAADPPLAMPFDGFMTEVNTYPGGLVYYDIGTAQTIGRLPIQPIETGAKLPITLDMQRDAREQVFRAFFRNILNLPVDGPNMTATEIMQRREEFLREIGPVFGRLETDYTAPMVERAFRIMLRAGKFLPIPEVLQGKSLRFEYESPVKRIRQQVEARAAEMWAQSIIATAVATARPEILDNVDFDELARFSHEAYGLPQKVLRGKDKVQSERTMRQQQQQAMAQMQAADQIASVAGKAAPALKLISGGQGA